MPPVSGRRDGKIVFDAELTLDHESPTTAAFDAHSGLALSLSVQAMECAIRRLANQASAW